MISFKFKGIKVKVYTDVKSFFGKTLVIPEGADFEHCEIIDEKTTEIGYSTGFAVLDEKTISLCVLKDCEFRDLLSTVSHELGHLIEGGFKKNPPQHERYDAIHEKKAEHYENFSLDAYDLTSRIMSTLK